MIALVVNSCFAFYKTTIPNLIESAKEAQVPLEHVYIVVGDCDTHVPMHTENGYNIVFCRYNNVDYNAAIYFTQTEEGRETLQKYTHFFYTHDTVDFLPHFWTNIQMAVCDSYIKLKSTSSCSTGLFHVQWFLETRTELLSYLVNFDPDKKICYKHGNREHVPRSEEIYKKFKNISRWLNEDLMFLWTEDFEPLGECFMTQEPRRFLVEKYGSERLASFYDPPGLVKFQKNFNGGIDGWKLTL